MKALYKIRVCGHFNSVFYYCTHNKIVQGDFCRILFKSLPTDELYHKEEVEQLDALFKYMGYTLIEGKDADLKALIPILRKKNALNEVAY